LLFFDKQTSLRLFAPCIWSWCESFHGGTNNAQPQNIVFIIRCANVDCTLRERRLYGLEPTVRLRGQAYEGLNKLQGADGKQQGSEGNKKARLMRACQTNSTIWCFFKFKIFALSLTTATQDFREPKTYQGHQGRAKKSHTGLPGTQDITGPPRKN
jgi:hypothetical protein